MLELEEDTSPSNNNSSLQLYRDSAQDHPHSAPIVERKNGLMWQQTHRISKFMGPYLLNAPAIRQHQNRTLRNQISQNTWIIRWLSTESRNPQVEPWQPLSAIRFLISQIRGAETGETSRILR